MGWAEASGPSPSCVQVGRENPAELKAQKLARSQARGVIDRDLKPNTNERRRIAAVLRSPPNKPPSAEERSLLWRFRWVGLGARVGLQVRRGG